MTLTPEDVANKQFTSRRLGSGYDETEVDDFLDEVEAELSRLYRENEDLRFRVETLQRELDQARRGGAPGGPPPAASRLPEPVAPPAAPPARMQPPQQEVEPDRATGILAMAQRTADQFITEARAESDRLLAQARGRAAEIARDAEERRRSLVGSLDTERSELQRKIEELRIFEREYRSRLRAYLENQLRELNNGEGDRGGDRGPRGESNGSGGRYAQTGPAFATFGGGSGRAGLPGRPEQEN